MRTTARSLLGAAVALALTAPVLPALVPSPASAAPVVTAVGSPAELGYDRIGVRRGRRRA